MSQSQILHFLGYDKAINIDSKDSHVTDIERVTLSEVKDFGIDKVYFTSTSTNQSFPSVFIKEVESFESEELRLISKIQRKIWNYRRVTFLFVYSVTEIRVYNCATRPVIVTSQDFDYATGLKALEIKSYSLDDKSKLQELNRLFSSIAIDSGTIWTLAEAQTIRKKLNLKQRVDKYLVDSLIATSKKLQTLGLELDFIHKMVMRSLFLLYLEDRGATNAEFYSKIKKGAKSYFDVLDSVKHTYVLFNKLEKHFNGNIFGLSKNELLTEEQLGIIKRCFISGVDLSPQIDLFPDWRIFDFSIIQIELISEIYEGFLNELNPKLKKKTGSYYTPLSLVELVLNDKLPIDSSSYNTKILDPSCGSGIFLVQSFKRLVRRYENSHKITLNDFDVLKQLMLDNIYGIEIQTQAIKVAAFSLHLALVDCLNPKTIWQNKNYRLPYLICDRNDNSLKKQGMNLFRTDAIETNFEIEKHKFDLVVGNPPFGTSNLIESIKSYTRKNKFAQEMVLPFLHKATHYSKNGQIALIFNTKVLTNTGGTYQNFRKWLFTECYVEKVYNFSILRNAPINFGGQLFGSATGPISIIFYKKNRPEDPSKKIMYYAPKTYIKSNVYEGVNIDSSNVKYLPREECEKSDTKIWKIGMWGSLKDFQFISKLRSLKSLGDFISNSGIKKGLGFQYLDKSTSNPKREGEIPNKYISPKNVTRYKSNNFGDLKSGVSEKSKEIYSNYYSLEFQEISKIDVFRRIGAKETFKGPHVLIKEGLSDWKICASYLNEDCSFNSKVIGLSHNNPKILKGITCFLNSKFAYYYLFLTSASVGIEREEIKPNEVFGLPFPLQLNELNQLSDLYDEISKIDIKLNKAEVKSIENRIDKLIFNSFSLTFNDQVIIEDFIEYTIPFFTKKYKGVLAKVTNAQLKSYLKILINQINEFLEDQKIFVNGVLYSVGKYSPLNLIKLSFDSNKEKIKVSKENLTEELKVLGDEILTSKSQNIFSLKKLNYKVEKEVFLIRPNQMRFWTRSMALSDSLELIIEILNED